MRELPDPEVADEIAEAQGFLTMWKSVTVKPMTTREVDFAKLVRKQAYEDGLRDAPAGYMLVPIDPTIEMKNAAIEAGEQAYIEHINHALADGPRPKFETSAEAIYSAMLTASKKEAP